MRKISADIIFPGHTAPLADSVLLAEDNGKILGIFPQADFEPSTIQHFSGALIPGFVNAHCHLELSHLKNKFPEKTGLPEFLNLVTGKRDTSHDEIENAIVEAEQEMIANGIVAVGDISNTIDTFKAKANHKIYYHTFVELIAFDPAKAPIAMKSGEAILAEARNYGIHASLAPHATYSTSPNLLTAITNLCCDTGKPTSIHMLESNDENEFYIQATGLYRKLYRDLNIDIKHFEPTGKNALESLLPYFNKEVNTLLIHNTIATAWDVEWAEEMHPNLYWCFCPQANVFIEDRLPDVPLLIKEAQFLCVGTDSLASNHGLSILDEIKVLQQKYPELSTADLLRWSTLYGAKALGIQDTFGSFETGKKPGINHLSGVKTANQDLSAAAIRPVI